MRVFRTLRQQNELIVQLKGVTPGHRIPPGALLRGVEGLKSGMIVRCRSNANYTCSDRVFFYIPELQKFQSAKELDLLNERRPEP